MTYEDRESYRGLMELTTTLRLRLEGDDDAPVSRAEARELLDLLEGTLERSSPERWDLVMEAVAHEAARRAGVMPATR